MRYRKVTPWEKPSPKKAAPWKRLGILALNFVLIFGLYEAAMALEWKAVLYVYMAALVILLCAAVYFNRGFNHKLPTREMLSDTMTEEEKNAFLERAARDHVRAQNLMLVIFPLILTFGIDLIYLHFFA